MVKDTSTGAGTCTHTRGAPGVSLHGIHIFMGRKRQSLYTEIKVICVRKRVCSSVCSVCTYMNIHMHDCSPTIYPVKMG